MLNRKMAWAVALVTSFLGLAYPFAVAISLWPDWENANRWIKNDPAFNIFMPFIFPLAVGIFLSAADFRHFRSLRRGQKALSLFGLCVLLFIAAFAVSSTFQRALLEPFLFKDASSALADEQRIRMDVIQPRYRHSRAIDDKEAASVERNAVDEIRDREVSAYMATFPALENFSVMKQRGSFCAWLALLLNSMAALFDTIVFWYFWNIVLFRRVFRLRKSEWIVLVAGLLIVWFPLRLYSEWYIGYYSFLTMTQYHIFVFLGVVALAAYAFCVFRLAKSLGLKVFSIAGTGLMGAIGVVGQVRPDLLGAFAIFFEDFPFQWFLAAMIIVLFALTAMVLSLLDL